MQERQGRTASGWGMLSLGILMLLGSLAGFIWGVASHNVATIIAMIVVSLLGLLVLGGLFMLEPNQAVVLLLFGEYTGTEKTAGFRWANPFYTKRKVSLRVRNFDSEKIKVNDKKGNPIDISAVVVWRVTNTAQAAFDVDDYVDYVIVQSESALRHLATSYAYDDTEGESHSLRSSLEDVNDTLQREIQERVQTAGVEVVEARINHLAYASEIASAMLQRQQAEAIIDARQKIVDGAVGMVQMALSQLSEAKVVDMDAHEKARLVGNLMVVLCSDKATQPVVQAGD